MPDDQDADGGPAPDREDLFGPSPGSGQPEGVAPEPDVRVTPVDGDARAGRAVPSGGDPQSPMFPPAPETEGDDGSVPAGSVPAGSDSGAGQSAAKGSVMSFFRELPVLLLVAFVLAFLLRTFVLQVFYIPSGSMEPTLQIDDRMVVEKLTYRFRGPERGEIVVFEGESLDTFQPGATPVQRVLRGMGQFLGVVPASARDFVKRVIGLPGDVVEVVDGEVLVNGQSLDEPYVVFEDPSDYGPVTVPDGNLFFLGDNRPNSSDSRRGLGFVPVEAVVGRAVVIIWPFGEARGLTEVLHDLTPASEGAQTPDPGAAEHHVVALDRGKVPIG